MEDKQPSLSSLILGVVLFAAVGSAALYILYLRAENAKLSRAERTTHTTMIAAPTAWSLSPEQRAAMLAILRGGEADSERLVWFATAQNNNTAASFQRSIQSVFEEAGWQVRGNVPVTFPVKPGIFVFMAEEEPPAYVQRAGAAIDAIGIPVSGGRGYRAFYGQKKLEDPNWRGFDMAPDQTYVVVVGRQPDAP